jgi:hypothetical protein
VAKYVYFFGGADLDKRTSNSAFAPRVREEFLIWLKSLRDKGHYLGSKRLADRTGARLTVRGGQVVEGPFMETKEAVGGVCFIEAGSLEEALDLARSCPSIVLQNGYVEVRVIDDEWEPADL